MSLELKGPKGAAVAVILIAGAIAAVYSVKNGLKTMEPSTVPALTASQKAAINASRGQLQTALSGNQAQMMQVGKVSFEQNCSSCHGDKGQGVTAPDLQLLGAATFTIAERIENGAGNRMPAFGNTLSIDKIAATAVYAKSLQKVATKQ